MIFCCVLCALGVGPSEAIIAFETSPSDVTLGIGGNLDICAPLLVNKVVESVIC